MKELTIDDLYIISGGAYTETQCVSGMTGAGAAIGALLGGAVGFGLGAAAGQAAGQIICPMTNNGNLSEDGDG